MLPAELTAACSNQYWSKVLSPSSESVVFNAQNVKICDESGIALLFQINHAGPNVKLINIPQDIQQVYVTMTKNMVAQAPAPKKKDLLLPVAHGSILSFREPRQSLTFLGESLCAIALYSYILGASVLKEILSVSDDTRKQRCRNCVPNRLLMGVIIAFETALVAQIFRCRYFLWSTESALLLPASSAL